MHLPMKYKLNNLQKVVKINKTRREPKRILYGNDVDLMNLFHPLKSEYVKRDPIEHPLVEKMPVDYYGGEA